MSFKSSAALLAIAALAILVSPRVLESDGLFVIPDAIGGPMNVATLSLCLVLFALTVLTLRSIQYGDEDN